MKKSNIANNIGVCKLCKKTAVIRNSHIIPEFLYEPYYSNKHKISEISIETKKSKIIQKGYRERLFCDECEKAFNNFESYASKLFKKAFFCNPNKKMKKYSEVLRQDIHFYNVHGICYDLFSKFILSLVYRSSISTVDYYNQCKLKDSRISQIEAIINDSKLVDHTIFPILIYKLKNSEFEKPLMINPGIYSLDNNLYWRFNTGNYIYLMGLFMETIPFGILHHCMKQSGTGVIIEVEFEKTHEFTVFSGDSA